MSGERDPFEVFREACMDALCKLPDVTAARLKVAYRLLRHGNRNCFRKERRFLAWPSRATLIGETNLPNGTVSDALVWLRRIGFWSDAAQGQRPMHLRRREISADFPNKVPAHRHFGAPKMPAHRHFKMPVQLSENAGAAPAKCRPTGNDSLIPAEDSLRGKPAGGGVPHHTQPAAGLPAPTPKPPPPRAGGEASERRPEGAGYAPLTGELAPPAPSPAEPIAEEGEPAPETTAALPSPSPAELAAKAAEERWEPATRRLLFGLGIDRTPSGSEIGIVKALIDDGCTVGDLDQAICRLANTGPAEPTTFNLSAIVGPAFSARNERRGLDVRRERNKSWNAQLRLTGAEYDHRPNRPRGPGPK